MLRASGMAPTSPEQFFSQLYVQQVEIVFLTDTFRRKDTLAPWLTPAVETRH